MAWRAVDLAMHVYIATRHLTESSASSICTARSEPQSVPREHLLR